MTEQEQAEVMAIEAEIKNLDAEFESWQENRGDVHGNQSEIYQRVGENIVKDAQYRQKRHELLQRKAEIEGGFPAWEGRPFQRKGEKICM